MTHATVRAANLPDIVHLIAQKYNLSEFDALDSFYKSGTGASYADDSTGLYGQSALFVFSLYVNEKAQ